MSDEPDLSDQAIAREYPTPWYIEEDWTNEVRAANKTLVVKLVLPWQDWLAQLMIRAVNAYLPLQPMCKGSWETGCCGTCSRCIQSAPEYIRRSKAYTRMIENAWERELGGVLLNKRHWIDAVVGTTRKLAELANHPSPVVKAKDATIEVARNLVDNGEYDADALDKLKAALSNYDKTRTVAS